MLHHLANSIEVIATLGALAGVGYYVLCLWSAAAFLRMDKAQRSDRAGSSFAPPVSILKPLKGIDPEMYECFRSHCQMEYPEYEIIFGVSDPRDPALPLVERLRQEFPEKSIQIIVCSENLGANTKVSNLAQMLRAARHEYLVVSDSDIRVEPDYLRRVVRTLENPKVGMVTCLYRGNAASTLGSRLESLGISTDFSPGVLAARQIEGGIRFGLGSTLAFRRRDLQTIGGFEAIADYLADDYEIGRRISDLGLEVQLSEAVVETFLPAYTLTGFASHQLRWARTIRAVRGGGYLGLGLTFGLPWAVLAVIFAGGAAWAWALLGAVIALRLAVALAAGMLVLEDAQLPKHLALLPLRDLFGWLIWAAGFAGRRVAWRGESFTLRNGKLTRTVP
jgi:ceramide glucosyltransferase